MVEIFGYTTGGESDRELLFDRVIPLLSRERISRVRALVNADDALRTLAGELMIRELAAVRLGVEPWEVSVGRAPGGKPYLPGVKGIHFNLSHSGRWVLCAIGGVPCGVDVEMIDSSVMEAAWLVFTSGELGWINASDKNIAVERFFTLWTLKESYLKFTGQGLRLDPRSFEIHCDFKTAILQGPEGRSLTLGIYRPDKNHRAALCARCPAPAGIKPWTLANSKIIRGD